MAIEDSLYFLFSGIPAVTELVSTRIYPLMLPESPTYPAVAFGWVSLVPDIDLDADHSDWVLGRLQITCFSRNSIAEARSIAEAFRAALIGYRTEPFQQFLFESLGADMFDMDSKAYYVPMDVMVRYTQAQ